MINVSNEQEEKIPQKKPSKNTRRLRDGFFGALVAGLAFVPLFFISQSVFEELYKRSEIGLNRNMDDAWFSMFCCLPTAAIGGLSGVLGGLVGSTLARKRFKRAGPGCGAVAGGCRGEACAGS